MPDNQNTKINAIINQRSLTMSEGHFATGKRALCHRKKGTFPNLGGLAPPPVPTPLCKSVSLINFCYKKKQLVLYLSTTGNKQCEHILLTSCEIVTHLLGTLSVQCYSDETGDTPSRHDVSTHNKEAYHYVDICDPI